MTTSLHERLPRVVSLFERAGLSTTIISVDNCSSGGNNRTYRVETSDGVFAVKQYFDYPNDTQKRLETEWDFLVYAASVSPHVVPRVYSRDSQNGLALHEFIEGRAIQSEDLTEHDIKQAAQFFCALNELQAKERAKFLPIASDASFSIEDNLKRIEERIRKLQCIVPKMEEDQEALRFSQIFYKIWKQLFKKIHATQLQIFHKHLKAEQRCISPSDFGFHNALRTIEGTVRFLDFEYAGWDDPAKMIADFFTQLAVPVSVRFFEQFSAIVEMAFPTMPDLMMRAKLLYPVCQLKWCCIALNVFLPIHLARRQFANSKLDLIELKRAQLNKAEKLMQSLEGVLS